MAERKKPKQTGGRDSYTLELAGLQPGAERPEVVVQAIGDDDKILHSQSIGADGRFAIILRLVNQSQIVMNDRGSDAVIERALQIGHGLFILFILEVEHAPIQPGLTHVRIERQSAIVIFNGF